MSLTNYAEEQALRAILEDTYVALFTSPPAEDGTGGVEVSDNGYLRQPWAPTYTQGNPTVAENSVTLQYAATGPWGEVTHAGVYDAPYGGNCIAVLTLVDPADGVTPLPKAIGSGDEVLFLPGEFTITLE